MPPSKRTLRIAAALARGVPAAKLAARHRLTVRRVNTIGAAAGRKAKVGGPRSKKYTGGTAAGREWLAVMLGVAEERGWTPPDAAVWFRDNLPRRK